jgi:hypothetical protein
VLRHLLLATWTGLLLAACGAPAANPPSPTAPVTSRPATAGVLPATANPAAPESAPPTAAPTPPDALALLPEEPPPDGSGQFTTDFSRHTIPYAEILSGGPPKDGIPAIDAPQFVSVAEADAWLEPIAAWLTASRIAALSLRAIKERPIARALFTRDTDLLGKLAQRGVALEAQPLASGGTLLSLLHTLGLLRQDVVPEAQAYAFSAVWAGFSLVDPLLSDDDQATLDVQVAALVAVVRHTFEPAVLPDEATLGEQVAPALRAFLAQVQAGIAQQIQARTIAAR